MIIVMPDAQSGQKGYFNSFDGEWNYESFFFDEFVPFIPPRGSVAASVQASLPDSKVAATLQHVPAQELGDLNQPLDSDILICSDDREATDLVAEVVGKIPGTRALDCGNLSNATAIEAFTAVLLQLNTRYRTRVALKLVGLE